MAEPELYQQTTPNSARASLLPALISALMGILIYAGTIGGTYVYDDHGLLEEDRRLRDPAQWGQYWTKSYNSAAENLFRPLVSMSFAVQWQLHGDRPWAFHLINVLLHGVVCGLVAELARRLFSTAIAWPAGLLFAVHPVHVEAVANIAGRAELMCAIGILGALVLMLRPLTVARAIAITCCLILALLSKEQGMLLPAMLLILGIVRGKSVSRNATLTLILFVCWTTAIYIVWRETFLPFFWDRYLLDWTVNPLVNAVGVDRWLMPLVLLGKYLTLLVAPITLSPDYGANVIGSHARLDDPRLYLGIVAILGWVALLAIALRRKWREVVFLCLAMGFVYALVGNLLTLIGTIFAERLMYIPSAFFLILAALFISKMPRLPQRTLLAVLIAVGAGLSFTYAIRWNDELHFYEQSLRDQPKSIRLHLLLAEALIKQGQLESAARVTDDARKLLPDYQDAWTQSGRVALERGDFSKAEEYFVHAMKLRPSAYVDAWFAELARRRAATQPSL